MRILRGKKDGCRGKIVVVCSNYNEKITGALLSGALTTLREGGVAEDQIDVIHVPGAFELSTAAYLVADHPDVAAVICLGAVIRGETPHFDYICQATATGIMRAGQDSRKPVTFGVITAENPEQAFERASGAIGNKGSEAAAAALEMLNVFTQWEN